MSNLTIQDRRYLPLTTGTPAAPRPESRPADGTKKEELSFQQALQQAARKNELSFSRHAVNRVEQRDIALTDTSVERLNQGIQIAKGKGLDSTLVLMDGSAFIVSAKNGTVITALGQGELRGKVITNIDGAVIL